jgi:hypothetical protein
MSQHRPGYADYRSVVSNRKMRAVAVDSDADERLTSVAIMGLAKSRALSFVVITTVVFIGGHEPEVAEDYASVVDLIKNTQREGAPDPGHSVPAHWFAATPAAIRNWCPSIRLGSRTSGHSHGREAEAGAGAERPRLTRNGRGPFWAYPDALTSSRPGGCAVVRISSSRPTGCCRAIGSCTGMCELIV